MYGRIGHAEGCDSFCSSMIVNHTVDASQIHVHVLLECLLYGCALSY